MHPSTSQIKERFFMPEGSYFLSHAMGCLPVSYETSVNTFFSQWKSQGNNAWDNWLDSIKTFQSNLAKLLGGDVEEFCPQVNISSAVSKIIGSLPSRKGRKKLLVSESAFSSTVFALGIGEALGYKMEVIKKDEDHDSILSNWEKILTEDVQLIFITHVLSDNGLRYPVKEIINLAKEKEIFTIVDIAQSAGIIPINLLEWNADFIVGTSVKWLCGGPGAAFLWANKVTETFHLKPIEVGWFSHKEPCKFYVHHFEHAEGAKRFWGGTPSVFPFIIAANSLNELLKIGIEKVYAHNVKLTSQLLDIFNELNLKVISPINEEHRSGTIVIQFTNKIVAESLFEREKILIDARSFGFRISPHIYNDENDIEMLRKSLLREVFDERNSINHGL
jgi:kynureninase